MRQVTFHATYQNGSPLPADEVITVELWPLYRREQDGSILNNRRQVHTFTGSKTVTLETTTPDWVWVARLTPKGMPSWVEYFPLLPGEIIDYTEIDKTSLIGTDPGDNPQESWWAYARAAIISMEKVGGRLVATRADGTETDLGRVDGLPGAAGVTPTLTVSETVTGEPGTEAEVTRTKSPLTGEYRDRFVIPRGDQGEPALGTEPQQEAIANWVAGDNPLANALNVQTAEVAAETTEATMGLVLAGATFDYARLQSAATEAQSAGRKLWAAGTITTNQTLTLLCNADLSGLLINYTGTGKAVRVGPASGSIQRVQISLPRLNHVSKTNNGWAQVAGTAGVSIGNIYTAEIAIPEVTNFETGVKLESTGAGMSYVNLHLGHLNNNKVNFQAAPGAGGWINQNNIYGGRMSHNSNEGTAVPGTRHVLMSAATHAVNNNNFWGTSLESPDTVEYHLDCAGLFNSWRGCRWENYGPGPRIIWRASTKGNVIDGGYDADRIVETREAGTANEIRSLSGSRMVGHGGSGKPVLTLENAFSAASPALTIMPAGAQSQSMNTATQWTWQLASTRIGGKRSTDAYDMVRMESTSGRLFIGDGAAEPTRYFGQTAAGYGFGGFTKTTVAPAAGAAGALPATPKGYWNVALDGEVVRIPYY